MRTLTEQEKTLLKEDQPQSFRVVVLTDDGSEYNLSNLNGKAYAKSISKSVSKDNRNATASVTFEDFEHELKLSYSELFKASNQLKVYIKQNEIWRFVFHGIIGDDTGKVTEHANGNISLNQVRDLSKILMDDYIGEADHEYQGWAEEVLQEILNDRFGENIFNLKVPAQSGFWIESYIPEYTSAWDALQKIADHIGWDLRFLFDERTNTFRLTFYMPERDPIFYDWQFEQDVLDSESVNNSDADIRNVIRIRNQKKAIDITVEDQESIDELSTNINGKSIGGRRYMEINEKETSLIDTEQEAINLGNSILYDLSNKPEKSKIKLRNKRSVFFNLEIHDSVQVINNTQRKAPQLFIVDSYSWTAQKDGFSTQLNVSNKVTIGYLRWFEKEKRFSKPIDPEELRTNPPLNVNNLSVVEDSFTDKWGQLQLKLYIDFDIPNDSRFQDAVIDLREEGRPYKQIGASDDGTFETKAIDLGKKYYIRVRSRSYGGTLSTGVEDEILITGKNNPPPKVENFIVAQDGASVSFRWDEINRDDIAGCEIREGANWDSGRLIGEGLTGTRHRTDREADGTKRYMIKAKDRSGQYSREPAISIFSVTDTGKDLNVIIERDELIEGNGEYDNLYNLDGVMKFYHNLSFADFPEISFETAENELPFDSMPDIRTDGTYISDAIDTYLISRAGIRIKSDVVATDDEGSMASYPDMSFADFPSYSFENPPARYDFEIYIKFSDDNVNWTEWQKFLTGEYKFRYCKFKIELSSESETAEINLNEFIELIDVPDTELKISELQIDSSGTIINFANYNTSFHEPPTEHTADVVQENGLKFPVFTEIDKDSIKIELYDINNNSVSGTAKNIRIEGY
jgi:hypothetical protein